MEPTAAAAASPTSTPTSAPAADQLHAQSHLSAFYRIQQSVPRRSDESGSGQQPVHRERDRSSRRSFRQRPVLGESRPARAYGFAERHLPVRHLQLERDGKRSNGNGTKGRRRDFLSVG